MNKKLYQIISRRICVQQDGVDSDSIDDDDDDDDYKEDELDGCGGGGGLMKM
jgi:hypothetical protein